MSQRGIRFRSGKTTGWLMYLIMNSLPSFSECCGLFVLRRSFIKLKMRPFKDFLTFCPPEIYKYDQTRHVAEFTNGSRVVFGHCANNKMRD